MARTSLFDVQWRVEGRKCGFVILPELWHKWSDDTLANYFNMDKLHGV
jgi:hypothetical protein